MFVVPFTFLVIKIKLENGDRLVVVLLIVVE